MRKRSDNGKEPKTVCEAGITLEGAFGLSIEEIKLWFRFVLRNIIRFRDKLRAEGENPQHVAVDSRTMEAFRILMELRKAGEALGLDLKPTL